MKDDKRELVSVIIPVYNSAKTIQRAIDSVIEQTYKNYEIIVVDDGSSDCTCSIVENCFPSVRLIRQKNSGAAAARNTGVKVCTGTLIAFLDSDDFWHKQKLEYQLSAFIQNPRLGICSTKCLFLLESEDINAKRQSSSEVGPCLQQQVSFRKMFVTPFLGTPSVIMRSTLFRKLNGFDESLETAEDIDLWIRAVHVSEYQLIVNPLTYVIVQNQSLSSRAKSSPYEAHLKVIRNFIESNKTSFLFKFFVVRKISAIIYCNWGSNLLLNNYTSEARRKLVMSFFLFPNFRSLYLFLKSTFY